jgi:ribosomal protein S18 acetylase RimI-like enzyme
MQIPDITLRSLKATDIKSVVKIHCAGFPNSRSTKLGEPFLKKMYQWYFLYNPRLSFVATLNGEIVGFVTGAIGGGTARRRFRYAFWQIVFGFLRHPQLFLQTEMFEAWQVHLRGLFVSVDRNQNPEAGKAEIVKVTLDSIAVAPPARSRDVGRLLVSAFEQAAQEQGATILGLGVESDNRIARQFYEHCGWRLTQDDIEHNSANYVKELQTS